MRADSIIVVIVILCHIGYCYSSNAHASIQFMCDKCRTETSGDALYIAPEVRSALDDGFFVQINTTGETLDMWLMSHPVKFLDYSFLWTHMEIRVQGIKNNDGLGPVIVQMYAIQEDSLPSDLSKEAFVGYKELLSFDKSGFEELDYRNYNSNLTDGQLLSVFRNDTYLLKTIVLTEDWNTMRYDENIFMLNTKILDRHARIAFHIESNRTNIYADLRNFGIFTQEFPLPCDETLIPGSGDDLFLTGSYWQKNKYYGGVAIDECVSSTQLTRYKKKMHTAIDVTVVRDVSETESLTTVQVLINVLGGTLSDHAHCPGSILANVTYNSEDNLWVVGPSEKNLVSEKNNDNKDPADQSLWNEDQYLREQLLSNCSVSHILAGAQLSFCNRRKIVGILAIRDPDCSGGTLHISEGDFKSSVNGFVVQANPWASHENYTFFSTSDYVEGTFVDHWKTRHIKAVACYDNSLSKDYLYLGIDFFGRVVAWGNLVGPIMNQEFRNNSVDKNFPFILSDLLEVNVTELVAPKGDLFVALSDVGTVYNVKVFSDTQSVDVRVSQVLHIPRIAHIFVSGRVGARVLAVTRRGHAYGWCSRLGSLKKTNIGSLWNSGFADKYGRLLPHPIISIRTYNIKGVSLGLESSVFVTTKGDVLVTGYNNQNELGLRSTGYIKTPTPVISLIGVTMLQCSSGNYHYICRDSAGRVWENGISVVSCSSFPTVYSDLSNEVIIWVGTEGLFNTVLTREGRFLVWGVAPQSMSNVWIDHPRITIGFPREGSNYRKDMPNVRCSKEYDGRRSIFSVASISQTSVLLIANDKLAVSFEGYTKSDLGNALIVLSEADGNVMLSISRTCDSLHLHSTLTVDVDSTISPIMSMVNGEYSGTVVPALEGIDYELLSRQLVWPPYDISLRYIHLRIINDEVYQAEKKFEISLRQSDDDVQVTAKVSILDDGDVGWLCFTQPFYNIKEDQGIAFINISRVGGISGSLYATVNETGTGTAIPKSAQRNDFDYMFLSLAVYWKDGDGDDKAVVMTVVNDQALDDPDKTVILELVGGNSIKSTQCNRKTLITILDDGDGGIIELEEALFYAKENNEWIGIDLLRHSGFSGTTTVQISVSTPAVTELETVGEYILGFLGEAIYRKLINSGIADKRCAPATPSIDYKPESFLHVFYDDKPDISQVVHKVILRVLNNGSFDKNKNSLAEEADVLYIELSVKRLNGTASIGRNSGVILIEKLSSPAPSSSNISVVTYLLPLIGIVMLFTVFAYTYWRYTRKRFRVLRRQWRLEWNDLSDLNPDFQDIRSRCNDLVATKAIYDGKPVFVELMQSSLRDENVRIFLDYHSLTHDNLIDFIAVILTPLPALVVEYSPRGGIDVMMNDGTLPMDFDFKCSIASDAANGLSFLHSKDLFHGQLSLKSLVFDSRFVCKVTGFHLREFRINTSLSVLVMWSAPEVLEVMLPSNITSYNMVSAYSALASAPSSHLSKSRMNLPGRNHVDDNIDDSTLAKDFSESSTTAVSSRRNSVFSQLAGSYFRRKTDESVSKIKGSVDYGSLINGPLADVYSMGMILFVLLMEVTSPYGEVPGVEGNFDIRNPKKHSQWEKLRKLIVGGYRPPVPTIYEISDIDNNEDVSKCVKSLTTYRTATSSIESEEFETITKRQWQQLHQPEMRFMEIARSCWSDFPMMRPEAPDIVERINALYPGHLAVIDCMQEKYSAHLELVVNDRTEQLRQEKDETDIILNKVERLLHNILPDHVVSRLQSNDHLIADRYENATVFFSDIISFTSMSHSADPVDIVMMLNALFTEMDSIAAIHGVDRIKTIGDAYMAACGVKDITCNHVERVAFFSLDALKIDVVMGGTGSRVTMRMSMHCGPVIAGVVGTSKFAYDLWGHTVNMASRMESNGDGGRACCSSDVFKALSDTFNFEKRPARDIKGIGIVDTYLLVGSKTSMPGRRDADLSLEDDAFNDEFSPQHSQISLPSLGKRKDTLDYSDKQYQSQLQRIIGIRNALELTSKDYRDLTLEVSRSKSRALNELGSSKNSSGDSSVLDKYKDSIRKMKMTRSLSVPLNEIPLDRCNNNVICDKGEDHCGTEINKENSRVKREKGSNIPRNDLRDTVILELDQISSEV